MISKKYGLPEANSEFYTRQNAKIAPQGKESIVFQPSIFRCYVEEK